MRRKGQGHLEAHDLLEGGSSVLDSLLCPLCLLLSASTGKLLLCPCLFPCTWAAALQAVTLVQLTELASGWLCAVI